MTKRPIMKKILITGSNGFVGKILFNSLLKENYDITELTRNKKKDTENNYIIADLSKPNCMDKVSLHKFDTIIHCAGELNNPDLMRKLHVDGTKYILDSIKKQKLESPPHWIQLSSVGVYGPQDSKNKRRIVTEESPYKPQGEYEVTKTESDQLVIKANKEGIIRHTILRPSNIFGSNMPNNSLRSLIHTIKSKRFFYIGNGDAISTYVHVDDVILGIIKSIEDPKAIGQIFNISSDCPQKLLIQHIANTLKISEPKLKLPIVAVTIITNILSKLITFPLNQSRIQSLINTTTYPSDKIRNELRLEFRKPMPSSIDDLIKELK